MAASPVVDPRAPALRAVRAALALLGLAAIAWQVRIVFQQPVPKPVNFFSFFTIESNLLLAAVFLRGALRPGSSPRRDAWRGATTLYLCVTGLVYATLLQTADAKLGLTAPWVNVVLHGLLPVAAIADWLLDPPSRPIAWRTARWWVAFPVVYFAYSEIRGWFTEWYPYPFLHPGLSGGYSGVALNALLVLAMILALLAAVRALGNARRRASTPPAATP